MTVGVQLAVPCLIAFGYGKVICQPVVNGVGLGASACGMVGFSTATFSVKYLCTHIALITILIFANS